MSLMRPLLITDDERLVEEVSRLAAVTGCEVRHRTDAASAGQPWRTAPLVFLDGPAAETASVLGLPRRPGVRIVSNGPAADFWRAAFEIGAEQVIHLPEDESLLVETLSEQRDTSAASSGRVLAVIGGCGGAGASVLSTTTALAAAYRGERALLVDCDPLGGGLDLAVGAEAASGARWSGITVSGGRIAASALRAALPERRVGSGELAVLACDREVASGGLTSQAVGAVIAAGRRAGETVVCDLPRASPEMITSVVRQADLTIVVIPAEVRASAAAARLVTGLRDTSPTPISAVVRGSAHSGLTASDVARAVGIDVLVTTREQPRLPALVDRGGLSSARVVTRGPMRRVVHEVLAALEKAPESSSLVGA